MKNRLFILNWRVRWMVLSIVDQTYTSSWNPGFEPRLVHVIFVVEKCLCWYWRICQYFYFPVSRLFHERSIYYPSVCLSVPAPRMPSHPQRTVRTDVTVRSLSSACKSIHLHTIAGFLSGIEHATYQTHVCH